MTKTNPLCDLGEWPVSERRRQSVFDVVRERDALAATIEAVRNFEVVWPDAPTHEEDDAAKRVKSQILAILDGTDTADILAERDERVRREAFFAGISHCCPARMDTEQMDAEFSEWLDSREVCESKS